MYIWSLDKSKLLEKCGRLTNIYMYRADRGTSHVFGIQLIMFEIGPLSTGFNASIWLI